MQKLSITTLRIASVRGANKQPGSGDVTFSDGQSYGFLVLPEMAGGHVAFFSERKRHGVWERFSFRSAKREAAFQSHLS